MSAARYAAAAQAVREDIGSPLVPLEQRDRDARAGRVAATLGAAVFAEASEGDLSGGRALGHDEVTRDLVGTRRDRVAVAEPDEGRAMNAIRIHADVGKDAELTVVRSLSRKEVERLGLKRGQVKAA